MIEIPCNDKTREIYSAEKTKRTSEQYVCGKSPEGLPWICTRAEGHKCLYHVAHAGDYVCFIWKD